MKSLLKASTVAALLFPFVALAQNVPPPNVSNINSLLGSIGGWVSTIAVMLIGVGLIVFFWGIITYVLAGADEEKRAAGRSLMIYGVIGLFVMVAIWGLVYFLGSAFGVEVGGGISTPAVPTGI